MIITVAFFGVMEMTGDEIVCVIAVRYDRMAARSRVNVPFVVRGAVVTVRALRGVRCIYGYPVFVNVISVCAVHVAVVKVIDVAFVLHRRVYAISVNVIVRAVCRVSAHAELLSRGRTFANTGNGFLSSRVFARARSASSAAVLHCK